MTGFYMAWSIVSLLTFLAHNYGTTIALRFLLGITETSVSLFLTWHAHQLLIIGSSTPEPSISSACSIHARK